MKDVFLVARFSPSLCHSLFEYVFTINLSQYAYGFHKHFSLSTSTRLARYLSPRFCFVYFTCSVDSLIHIMPFPCGLDSAALAVPNACRPSRTLYFQFISQMQYIHGTSFPKILFAIARCLPNLYKNRVHATVKFVV